jgi:type IV pilus assembly protein PilZ
LIIYIHEKPKRAKLDAVQEKRQHPRKPLHPPVSFTLASGQRFPGECGDISLGGAYIETPQPAPFGDIVTVHMQLLGIEAEVNVKATVRWTKPGGMGVQFSPMGARETHALVTMLKG